jgi:predicted MFS family arabinose efflux permease
VSQPAARPAAGTLPIAFDASRAWYALGLLLVVMVVCHVDRNILNILIRPIKREFGVSDTAIGFLTGPAFAIFYTLAGVPLSVLSDRTSRKWVLVVGLALWSLMTAAQGWARVFWELTAARLLVGVGEATCGPNSHAILSDYFPPERRATALAVFSLGGHVGMLIGFAFGGYASEALGWRDAFVVVGLPGLLLAALVGASLREPPRASAASSGFAETLRYMARKPTFRQTTLAASLYTTCAYGFNVWGNSFLIRSHGWSEAQAGLWFGIATGLTGIAGTIVAGRISDRLWRRDPRWAPWVGSIGGVAMLPFSLGFLLAPDPRLALALYSLQVFLGTFWMGPTFATVQALAEPRMRAQAAALILLTVNVIGMGLGPQMIGLLSDALRPAFGDQALRWALLVPVVCAPWAALHGWLASRSMRRDLEQTIA